MRVRNLFGVSNEPVQEVSCIEAFFVLVPSVHDTSFNNIMSLVLVARFAEDKTD